MKLYRDFVDLPGESIASIGKFAAFHQGHLAIFEKIQNLAKARHLISVIIILVQGKDLILPRERLEILKKYDIEYVFWVDFAKICSISAEDFVTQILQKKLRVQSLVEGLDFHFGKDRRGDSAFLKTKNIETIAMPDLFLNFTRLSSQKIKDAILNADFPFLQLALNRRYSLSGHVCYGNQIGRTLGYKTANIALSANLITPSGVFAAQVLIDNVYYFGILNCGTKPTIGENKKNLEVHIFNFNQNIYGKRIQVFFLQKIRDEKKFTNLTELKKQLAKDEEVVMLKYRKFSC